MRLADAALCTSVNPEPRTRVALSLSISPSMQRSAWKRTTIPVESPPELLISMCAVYFRKTLKCRHVSLYSLWYGFFKLPTRKQFVVPRAFGAQNLWQSFHNSSGTFLVCWIITLEMLKLWYIPLTLWNHFWNIDYTIMIRESCNVISCKSERWLWSFIPLMHAVSWNQMCLSHSNRSCSLKVHYVQWRQVSLCLSPSLAHSLSDRHTHSSKWMLN